MASTPKPVRKAAKKFLSAMRKSGSTKKEYKKEEKLAKSQYHVESPKYKKTVASDFNKMTKEVKRGKSR